MTARSMDWAGANEPPCAVTPRVGLRFSARRREGLAARTVVVGLCRCGGPTVGGCAIRPPGGSPPPYRRESWWGPDRADSFEGLGTHSTNERPSEPLRTQNPVRYRQAMQTAIRCWRACSEPEPTAVQDPASPPRTSIACLSVSENNGPVEREVRDSHRWPAPIARPRSTGRSGCRRAKARQAYPSRDRTSRDLRWGPRARPSPSAEGWP